jgi:branched-chain amino acid transport system substrate-binding protein
MCVGWGLIAGLAGVLVVSTPAVASSVGAAASTANTIRIGGNFDLTGRFAYYGAMVADGAKLAFKEANEAGGVLGRKIEFVLLDNASDKAKTAVVMKSLAARGNVSAVLGCLTAANTAAAYVIAEQSRLPLISPSATSCRLTGDDGKVNSYAFLACFADPSQANVMARFAIEELGVKTAAIVFDNRVRMSSTMAAGFEKVFTQAGGTIVAKEKSNSGGEFSQDFLSQVRNANPEVIFIPLYYREAGQAIRCLREGGIRVPILGPDPWDSARIVAYAGEEALNDIYYFSHYAKREKLPKVGKFVEDFAKEYKRPADLFAAMGYEAALILIEAIKKAGSADPENVRTALEGIEVEGLLGTIRIDANDHSVTRAAVVKRMIEGQPLAYRLLKP